MQQANRRVAYLALRQEQYDTFYLCPHAKYHSIGEDPSAHQLKVGLLKGHLDISDDFDAPLAEDLISAFEGGECEYF
ncbi:hypothetical protein [Algicola sagamiensis]|uniref:hypothetical protein n=1 Tax=Algicola sagamiensis TaxID=163869 RepID=UPI00036E14C1|nr:hypothetical protein [Algicola sagamiensis]